MVHSDDFIMQIMSTTCMVVCIIAVGLSGTSTRKKKLFFCNSQCITRILRQYSQRGYVLPCVGLVDQRLRLSLGIWDVGEMDQLGVQAVHVSCPRAVQLLCCCVLAEKPPFPMTCFISTVTVCAANREIASDSSSNYSHGSVHMLTILVNSQYSTVLIL